MEHQQPITDRESWPRWRHQGIGSSDAPIIMGKSPWKTPLQLHEQKVNPFGWQEDEDAAKNPIIQKGNIVEPKIRNLLSFMHGLGPDGIEVALVVLDGFPYLRASLDGRQKNNHKIIYEIKLLGKDDWTKAKEKNEIPLKYVDQVHHQLMVTGAEVCHFVGLLHDPEDMNQTPTVESLAIVPVYPNQTYHATLMQEEVKFWDGVLKKKPPQPTDKDYKPLTGLSKQTKRWLSLKEKAEKIEAEMEELKKEILEAADRQGHPRFLCAGVRLRRESRQGSVDYKKIPAIKAMKPEELDQYRSPGSVYWKMEVVKESNE